MSFLKIDNREKDLIQYYEQKGINIKKENLNVGDIQIINDESKNEVNEVNEINEINEINEVNEDILVLIERKTYDDLSTSIKDGRYKEQKNRILNAINKNVRKIYILEGNKKDFKLPKSVLEGTIINTMIRDNIHIFISKNIEDTFNFINNIHKNIDKYKTNILNDSQVIDTNNVLIHSIKKSNMNSETCFMNMLSGIPGISKKTALVFVEKYKNINNMFYYFNVDLQNNSELIIAELENMKVSSNQRKLGNKSASKIYDFLCK
jgi:crossover junction endonuclease MUS81